ncbi:FimV/HubP family polar landmark protein [Paraburkholderia sp.]|uniref:FimV/HubP family polar landmark protein n=1 Tax=Paraburkholderia sp. TaxID=1926495 RepID=UPI003D6ED6A2
MTVRQPGPLRPALRSRLYRWPVAATAALFITGTCVAQDAPASAASASSAVSPVDASEPVSAIGLPAAQYTVRVGQSLNDIALAITQSHDRATLARASRALFDANPAAFMGHDPSRMKIGAVLNVPALDASGTPVGASGAAAASSASASVSTAASTAAAASAAKPTGFTAAALAALAAMSASSATAPASAVDAAQAASQPSAAPQDAHASGAHVWTGAIQQSASAPDAASAEAASQPRAQVSSLQQLLALKNRVLMELQKHGIGSTGQPKTGTDGASAVAVAPAASGSSALTVPAVPVASAGSRSLSDGGQFGFTQTQLGIAAVIGAALVVLLTGLSMRKRRPAKPAADAAKQSDVPARPATLLEKDAAAYAARLQAQHPAADGATQDESPSAATTSTAEHPSLDGATTAASLAAAAEPGAEALPVQTIQPVEGNLPHAVDEPQATALPSVDGEKQNESPSLDEATTAASLSAAAEPGADAPPVETIQPTASDPHAAPSSIEAEEAHAAPPAVEPTLPQASFPRDAIAALDSLDLSLPPRSGPVADVSQQATDLPPEPAPHEPVPFADTEAPSPIEQPAAESPAPAATPHEPTHATETPTAIAGLGAARFGALNLDFDLELPPSPAQPIPAFTPEELARIARNKLDLASEYIELGDLNGARTLINEVIAANDIGTRDEARALLSTLAPLS